jgi:2-oxoglutarate ferredoxin oxidoreductase subunit gamma
MGDISKIEREEIVIAGSGGQGVNLLGIIIGQAAIFDGKNAAMIKDYGPAMRGGHSCAQLVISNNSTSYPYITNCTSLMALSQQAYDQYAFYEPRVMVIGGDLVEARGITKSKVFAIPATKMAEKLGSAGVANIVMLGFFVAITRIVSLEAIQKSILSSVSEKMPELNMKAFQHGYSYGLEAAGESL